jgi:hypothetical protein
MKDRSKINELIRSIVKDMNACWGFQRCSWTREEVYPLVREIERLRAMLAINRGYR